MRRLGMLAALATLAMLPLLGGCNIDPFCLDCVATGDAGAGDADPTMGDGGVDPSGDGGVGPDACVSSGTEVCDGKDNDCNGLVDDDPEQVGDACGTGLPLPCKPGIYACTGGTLVCGSGGQGPTAEACNGIDDDCDGTPDDGDPGGGVICGVAQGDCQRGLTACVDLGGTKQLDCVGDIEAAPVFCDNHDNDCDGLIDDGNPEGGAPCGFGMGLCVPGTITCQGGALQCLGASTPTLEICDGKDNDCNGMTDETFNLQTDKKNCGVCGNKCLAANAITACQLGGCKIVGCVTGFFDDVTKPGVDCDYACDFQGAEICNGEDDDCDGVMDDGVVAPDICADLGACSTGTTTMCQGAAGWRCLYGPNVNKDALGNIIPETDCDNRDDDCDGDTDESFAQKGAACADMGVGVCQGKGQNACNALQNGLTCNITTPGIAMSAEKCNGKDDNCNGTVDEGAGDNWVKITVPTGMGGATVDRWIYKWEASRPDATAASQGALASRSCSNDAVLPWTNVTFGQAETACAAAGGRLCSEPEWQRACATAAGTACNWGMSSCTTYTTTSCNGNDFDFNPATPATDEDGLRAAGSMAACFADWGSTTDRVFDLSGNVKEWTQAAAGDPAGTRRLRGGSFNNTQLGLRCDFRFAVADADFLFANVGFRCCRDTAP